MTVAVKIRKNDTVAVVRGKDRGKTGKVLSVHPGDGRLVIEGINLVTRHVRATPTVRQAGIIKQPGPLSIANVKLICTKCGKAARVGFQVLETSEGGAPVRRKVRICKKCKQQIE